MAEAFVLNMDALVTRDYLDQCLDARFAEHEKRIDERFTRFQAQVDASFDKQGARLADHDLQFAEIRGELKLHRWMLAIIAASTVIPALQKLFTLLAG